ncbi:protein kinase [bacterium]|nr:protein kinase [bacterium]
MTGEQREHRADPLKLKRLRLAAGWTVSEFCSEAEIDKTTGAKVLRGDPVFLGTIVQVGKAFMVENYLEILHPEELLALGITPSGDSDRHVLEWEIDEFLTGWEKATNGLQYQLVRLQHRYLRGRQARGKCYEMRHLSHADRDRLTEHLRRHPDVCERIGDHPNIAKNLTAAWVREQWWVLDQWEEGETLAHRLKSGPLNDYTLRLVMNGIAAGLHALHQAGVIRRELSPRFVLLRESNDKPVLTDFELAKLLEGATSVSPDEWPDDLYRAEEVAGDTPIDERADVYSWGRVFVHAACGELPGRGKESTILAKCQLPDKVRSIVVESLNVARSKRPKSMTSILDALEGWR